MMHHTTCSRTLESARVLPPKHNAHSTERFNEGSVDGRHFGQKSSAHADHDGALSLSLSLFARSSSNRYLEVHLNLHLFLWSDLVERFFGLISRFFFLFKLKASCRVQIFCIFNLAEKSRNFIHRRYQSVCRSSVYFNFADL